MIKTPIAATLVLLAGCASTASEDAAKAPTSADDPLITFNDPVMPAQPALCAAPTTLNLPDAAWASWFADIAYSVIGVAAPAVERYGFGKVGEGNTYLAEASAVVIAQIAGTADADAKQKALYATVHPDRGMEFFSVGETQLLWANHRTDNVAYVSFRGTFALDDAFSDVDAWLVPGPIAGNVHEGFLKAEALTESLVDQRLALLPKDATVVVTGHSAGAALATLWVAHAISKGATQHFVIDTFGSPRVGDATFAAAFESMMKDHAVPVFRFHHGDDPVPTQPGEYLGYKHVGVPVHLTADGAELNDSYAISGIGNIHDHAKDAYLTFTTQRFLLQQPAYAVTGSGDFASVTAASLSACK